MATIENLTFEVSIGRNGSLGKVQTKKKTWKTFKRMFSEQTLLRDNMTFAQYAAMDLDKQQERKKAPGNWSPAVFEGGVRRGHNQRYRTGIVFDLDYITVEQLEAIKDAETPIARFRSFMHTTRSHCPELPRVRMIIPVSRKMSLEENNAITRHLACELAKDPEEGIEIPDIISMKSNQVMYLPSVSRDQEYWTLENEGDLLDVDDYLAQHEGWEDYATLPYQEKEKHRSQVDKDRKMESPVEKEGVIGAFCRAYPISEAIAEFLPDVYEPGDDSGSLTRYSYLLGGGRNGAIVYDDDLILHSHHGSDPVESANAFDMVRLHLFGHLDEKAREGTLIGNMPSFKKMSEWARDLEPVKAEMLADMIADDEWDDDEEEDEDEGDEDEDDEGLREVDDLLGGDEPTDGSDLDDLLGGGDDDENELDFDDDDEEEDSSSDIDDLLGGGDEPKKSKKNRGKDKKRDWSQDLMLDKQGVIEKNLHNCKTIVKNSNRIAPCIALNDLDGGPYLLKKLRFPRADLAQAVVDNKVDGRRWTDTDTAALMCALSAPVKLGGFETQFTRQDVELSLLQASEQNRYNPFLDKVLSIEWDGVPRLATFFHDWFRCKQSEYHAELATVWFIAGIARQYEPGHRFDLVPILGGRQGGGKTGAIEALGLGYGGSLSGEFGDTQKMTESTKGKVVLEVPELKGMSKGEVEDIKHYFTATKDTIRLAYRRNEEDFYRRCVYMGTTNQQHYLRDEENRRFCPVLTDTGQHNMVDFDNFLPLIPQFWAEAHALYLEMREEKPKGFLPLRFTSPAAKEEAERLQTESRETMAHEPVAEVIERWLNEPLTEDEVKLIEGGYVPDPLDSEFDDEDQSDRLFVRNLVTVTMIRESLSTNPIVRDLRGAHADKTIAQALRALEGWGTVGAGPVHRYGRKARWYCREGEDSRLAFIEKPSAGAPGGIDDLLS